MYRIIETLKGARIEKRDENSYNGYREIAKIFVTDHEQESHEVVEELREVIES